MYNKKRWLRVKTWNFEWLVIKSIHFTEASIQAETKRIDIPNQLLAPPDRYVLK